MKESLFIEDRDEPYIRAITANYPNVILIEIDETVEDTRDTIRKILRRRNQAPKLIFGTLEHSIKKRGNLTVITHDKKTHSEIVLEAEVEEKGPDETILIKTQTRNYILLLRGNEAERASLKFIRNGYLDYSDSIPNGFVICSHKSQERISLTDEDTLHFKALKGDMLMLDSTRDEKLRGIVNEAKRIVSSKKTAKDKALALSQYVFEITGGKQKDLLSRTLEDAKRIKEEGNDLDYESGNFLPIGEFKFGVCIHKSVLYKYLADRTGIRCRLVEGALFNDEHLAASFQERIDEGHPMYMHTTVEDSGYHAWNVVQIDGVDYLLDIQNSPNQLKRTSTQYKRMKGHRVIGKWGEDSVMRRLPKRAA